MSTSGLFILPAALFSVGLYGVLARRNLILMLMSVELMLNASNFVLAGVARMHAGVSGDSAAGQAFILMSMAVAACEVAVGLSIVIAFFRTNRSVDVNAPEATQLRG